MSIIISTLVFTSLVVASSSPALAATAKKMEMPPLARKHSCVACHAMDKKMVGPAWMDISRKYKGATEYTFKGKMYPLEEGLILKVSKGGSGVWGSMPMPANSPAVKPAEIKELVQFILRLSK